MPRTSPAAVSGLQLVGRCASQPLLLFFYTPKHEEMCLNVPWQAQRKQRRSTSTFFHSVCPFLTWAYVSNHASCWKCSMQAWKDWYAKAELLFRILIVNLPFWRKDIIMTCQCQTKYTCTTVQPIIIINLYNIYMGQCNHPATSLLVGIGPSALRRHDDPRKRYKENKATGWFGALGKVTNYVFMILLIWKATWRQKTQVDFTWPACDLNLDGEVSLKRNAHIL